MIDLGKCKICDIDLNKQHTIWINNDNSEIKNCNLCHDSLKYPNYVYHDSSIYRIEEMLLAILKKLG